MRFKPERFVMIMWSLFWRFTFIVISNHALCVSNEDNLIDHVLSQNEQTLSKIKSYSCHIDFSSSVAIGDIRRVNEGSGDVVASGKSKWAAFTEQGKYSSGEMVKLTCEMVINNKYFALWPKAGNTYAYQYDHRSINEMSDDAQAHVDGIDLPDIAGYGFCEGGRVFREYMSSWKGARWTMKKVTDEKGRIAYELMRYVSNTSMKAHSTPAAVWVFDPEQGFLITSRTAFDSDGTLRVRREIQIARNGDGIFFPISYRESLHEKSGESVYEGKISKLTMNMPVKESQFEIEALKLPVFVKILRTGLDGKMTVWNQVNGKYIESQANIKAD